MDTRNTLWALVLPLSLHVIGGAAPVRDVPVVSTIVGAGDSDTRHTVQSDGNVYLHAVKGNSGVESHIQSGGDYELDIYYFTSNRRLYFDLRSLVPGTGAADAPSAVVLAPGRLISKCGDTGTNNYLQMDPMSSLYNCNIDGRFDYNGRTFLVRMDEAAFPGTRNVKVTCTGTDPANASQCSHWKVETCTQADSASGTCTQWGFNSGPVDLSANVMTILEERQTAKGKTTTTKVGDYYMQFEIYLSRQ